MWTQDHNSFSTDRASFQAMLDAHKEELAAGNFFERKTVEDLLDKVAGTLAYFQVSSRRFCDNVPMHIRHHLVQGFSKVVDQLPICVTALSSNDVSAETDSDGEAVPSMPQQIAGIVAAYGELRTSNGRAQQRLQLGKSAEALLTELESASELREQLTAMQQQLRKGVQILQAF